ncbi:MAG TPA: nicotinate-nucleotide--dimethylbenzimidazole phosphoribosyltransferase, partial [Clostridia bacterium]|nr:nicotinate-nucleotide--dimethylbenzimidazole phosphoribosyltransferase [Clostridia bacterium]
MILQGLLQETIQAVRPRDASAERKARARLDALCKPPGSLGKLEDMAAQLHGIFGGEPSVARRCVLIFCADNGVALDGV